MISVRNLFAHRLDVRDFEHPEVLKIASDLVAMPSQGRLRIATDSGWVELFTETLERRYLLAALNVCLTVFRGNARNESFELTAPNVRGPWQSISFQAPPQAPEGNEEV